jgi:hypothetical protein
MVHTDIYQDNALMLLSYARNVMHAVEAASKEAACLVAWLSRNRERFGMPDSLFVEGDSERDEYKSEAPRIDKARWQTITDTVDAALVAPGGETVTSEANIAAGLRTVSAALGFDPLDTALFEIIFLYRTDNPFERLFDSLATARGRLGILRRYPDMFALFTSAPRAEVNLRFRADAQLLVAGAISIDQEGDINLAPRLRSLVEQCAEQNCDVRTELLGNPLDAKLPFSAFRHLGREIDVAFAILHRALAAANTDHPERGASSGFVPTTLPIPTTSASSNGRSRTATATDRSTSPSGYTSSTRVPSTAPRRPIGENHTTDTLIVEKWGEACYRSCARWQQRMIALQNLMTG